MKKKNSHSAVIYTPGRWTGNNFFLRVASERLDVDRELGGRIVVEILFQVDESTNLITVSGYMQ